MQVIGSLTVYDLSDTLKSEINEKFGNIVGYNQFLRLKTGNTVLTCKHYKSSKRRNSYIISYGVCKLGQILYFLECEQETGFIYVAVVKCFEIGSFSKNNVRHIKRVKMSKNTIVIDVAEIEGQCVYMKYEKEMFIST